MTDPPRGWELSSLAEVGRWGSGGTPRATTPRFYGGAIPWAVIGDLNDGLVAETAAKITEDGLRESSAKLVQPGTVLLAMYGSIGKLGMAGVEMATNQAIAFVRSAQGVEARYLFWYLRSQRARLSSAGKGATQKNISQTVLRDWPIPVPPTEEQRRIVAAIEEQFSRLDAAEAALADAERWRRALERVVLAQLTTRPAAHWPVVSVNDVGRVQLGRQRSPKHHHGPGMRPYLRVANVFENRIDLSDVKEMAFTPQEVVRYELHAGDILLNEGQSPHLVGRPAMYRGELPGCCFTNSLIRFQAGPEVDPAFALLVFRSHLHSGRFQREAQITTNIAHMAAGRFKTVEFPLPSIEEQRRVVSLFEEHLSRIDALGAAVRAARLRGAALRRSILERAFRGELVPQDPSDEPASVLLERIRAERAARPKPRRARRAGAAQAS